MTNQTPPKLSIIVPVYNEEKTVCDIVRRLCGLSRDLQVIVVDDGSVDGTRNQLEQLTAENEEIKVLRHEVNQGKGAAIRTAIPIARGIAVAIQDADLEYDPADLSKLFRPIVDNEADVVFGNRFHQANHVQAVPMHAAANRLITACCNRFLRSTLHDVETCYKVVRRDLLSQISLEERGFAVEIELAIKLQAIDGVRCLELPIRYSPRTRSDGKKIRAKDGVRALWAILRYGFEVNAGGPH